MATITDVRLRVMRRGDDAAVHIAFDVAFDAFDVASNQLYQQSWALAGNGYPEIDGLSASFAEQEALEIVRFAADGQSSTSRDIDIAIRRGQLEHGSSGPKELKAIITLTPVGPFGDSAQSNRVALVEESPP